MNRKFRLEEVTAAGRVEIGALSHEPTVVGREPDYGIAIRSEAVSGEHGVFLPFRGHWFYKDLGSSNGSWVNGLEAPEGMPFFVREGDNLQIADRVIRFSEVPGQGAASNNLQGAPRSLILISRGELIDEFPLPEVGRAMVIGGSKADLKLDIDIYDLPSLVIESRGDHNVVVYSVAKEIPIYLNGKVIDRSVTLKDRDEVVLEHYRIIVNTPPPPASLLPAPAPESLTSWDDSFKGNRTVVNLPFGKESPADRRDSVPINESYLKSTYSGAGDSHPSMRGRSAPPSHAPPSLDLLADKIIIVVGSLLLVALLALLILWAVG